MLMMMKSENSTISENVIKDLVEKAAEVKLYAYCPYSKFPVGAAVLTSDGSIFTGRSKARPSLR